MKTDEILQLTENHSVPRSLEGESEEILNLGRIARALGRNWWIIAGVTTLATVAAGIKVVTSPSQSVGRFEILVQPGSAEANVIANIPESFSSGETPRLITVDDDLLKILKSPKVLAPVIAYVQANYPSLCDIPSVSAGEEDSSVSDPTVISDFCYKGVSKRLSVSALEDTLDEDSTIVRAVFQDDDSQAVAAVLDELSQAYLDYSLATKQADIRRGIEFVEQKLPDLRGKVEALQTQLQNLRLQNDIIDPSTRAVQLAEQIGAFSQEQLDVSVQLAQARRVANDLGQQLVQAGAQASSSALSQNTRYQTLLNTLLELDAQIAEASTLYLETSPDMQVLQEQRQNLLLLLASEGEQSQREIVSQIRELETRETALTQTLESLDADMNQLSGVARTYDDIQRELGIAAENLNQFIAKREALEIDAAQREIPWELVTPPTLPEAVTTSLLRYLLLGGTLGLLLGIGIALLVDESSGVIYSEEEIRRSTRLPVLATIPDYTAADELVVSKSPITARQYADVGAGRGSRFNSADTNDSHGWSGYGSRNGNGGGSYASEDASKNGSVRNRFSYDGLENGASMRGGKIPSYAQDPFSESFRSLYTNLRLLSSATDPIRSIAVSSVMAGEGKSTVALHLAEAAAAMGKRVLLVDGDLRNPQIHNYLELSNEKGLTNLFSGESNPAIIQRFSPEPNMYVIAAGSAFFDPTRLFSSRSMKRFNKKVEARFDLVIYDTPPLLGQSDAYLIADNADGMLLVTRPGKLKQPLLTRAMEQLRIADINILGVVARES